MRRLYWSGAATILALLIPALASAQGYLNGPALNKKIVTDFYRLVFEPRNTDLIDQFVGADFVEHNPKAQGGRDALVQFLKTLPRPASEDVEATMKNPPAYIVAEGDLVTFVFKQATPDPKSKSVAYDRFSFDMFRIRNGKIVEHWDGEMR